MSIIMRRGKDYELDAMADRFGGLLLFDRFLRDERDAGESCEAIAATIAHATDIRVSYQTVGRWLERRGIA